jgi:hypothetical protein
MWCYIPKKRGNLDMSYCRCGTNSDMYAYCSGDTYELIFAGAKLKEGSRRRWKYLSDMMANNNGNPLKQSSLWAEMKELWEPIPLKLDKASYIFDTPRELYNKMLEGQTAGYKVPKYVLNHVLADAKSYEKTIKGKI